MMFKINIKYYSIYKYLYFKYFLVYYIFILFKEAYIFFYILNKYYNILLINLIIIYNS